MYVMTFENFVARVVDDGVRAATRDYVQERQAPLLEGSLAGFEACRGLEPGELARLLRAARIKSASAWRQDPEERLWRRGYEAEVEWVCNVVSVLLVQAGLPAIVGPTGRAVTKALDVFKSMKGEERGATHD